MKLCINSRDDLLIVSLDNVAYFLADGNYTVVNYISGQKMAVSLGLSKMEVLISNAFPAGEASSFVKIGRSLIINQNYLCRIDTVRQRLVLSDFSDNVVALPVTKALLRNYKKHIYGQIHNSK